MAIKPYLEEEDEDRDVNADGGDFGFSGAQTLDMMELPGPRGGNDPGVAAAVSVPSTQSGTAGFPEDDPFNFGDGPTIDRNQTTEPSTYKTDPGFVDDMTFAGGTGPNVYSGQGPEILSGQGPTDIGVGGTVEDMMALQQKQPGIAPEADPTKDEQYYKDLQASGVTPEEYATQQGWMDDYNAQKAAHEAKYGATPESGQGPTDIGVGGTVEEGIAQAGQPGGSILAPDAAPGMGEGTTGQPQPAPFSPAGQPSGGRPSQGTASIPPGVQGPLQKAINDALQNPSRYDSEVVRNAASVIQEQIGQMRKEGYRGLGEHFAGRGLLGSSVEATGMGEFEEDLQRIGSERMSALGREQAMTYGQDRASAINAGLGSRGQDITKEGMDRDSQIREKALQLQAQGMSQDAAYRQASLSLQGELGRGRMDIDRENMALRRDQFGADLDYRDKAFEWGQSMDQAGMDYRDKAFGWGQEMDQAGLDMRREQMENDSGFRQRSQDLQEQGMNQDEAYRQAQSEWSNQFAEQGFDFSKERWGDQESTAKMNMMIQAWKAGLL